VPGVLDKVVDILAALESEPLSLAELVRVSRLPRATAHRLAVALERHDLLRRDDDGRFALGSRLIGLGRAAADGYPLRELARPALVQLRDSTGESVQLYVREHDGRRCVLSLQSPHALRWIVPEGALLPLERGSAGRVLAPLAAAQAGIGRDGWIASVEEREPGAASVSAPVHGADGAVVAAVSLSGPVERLSRQPGRRFGAAVVAAARQIEQALGG
jgi:DNA-binding IclR family transcriptional regulator